MMKVSVVVLLLLAGSLAASAAFSGGRMGGTSFRSSSRTRSSSYHHSRSTPSPSSYHSTPSTIVIGWPTIIILFAICFVIILRYVIAMTTSVVKLQVGLLGMATSLQKDLNQIAHIADTSTPKGFTYILRETALSVLQHHDYCNSAYSSVELKMGVEECEKLFNKLSKEERVKVHEETLVNFNNIKKQSATTHEEVSHGACNQYIVVTIIVAARGVHELQPIRSSEHLKIALKKLASIPSKDVLAAEVLWTPQKENDVFTEQEMLEGYPLLRSHFWDYFHIF
ncbi:hypothetical protein SSX86_019459 [Deinandra increscens subsp. villosa]|uniref:Uncharacterized protein n=1 Tax=Deinandra increscens subsp. villosa TaxID=3103831 RepID=A0AAP0CZW2_9ASTR